jgi:D-serine deaminase-like pyridoxal phosphate-dependent protein
MASTDTSATPRLTPQRSWEDYEALFADVDAPFALVDLDAMWSNAAEMLGRARGKPIRVASKSVRSRPLLEAILARDGYRGLMTFTLPEALWLHGHGFRDLLMAYPTADRAALAELPRLEAPGAPILMVDSVEQLDLIASAASGARVRVCIEIDVSYWALAGRLKVGAKRSPVRTPAQAATLAREIARRPGLELVGIMGYEAQIAGVGDRPLGKPLEAPAIRVLKRRSAAEIAERRAAVVDAVSEVAPVDLVNGGGTGSLHTTSTEAVVTELTAGSGFYAPALFDSYTSFALTPAAMFALPVVRRPSRGAVTALGGGYHASGPAGTDRLPQPYLPRGLRLDPREGAGEVQTPLSGEPARRLRIGERVYMRHAKAGELCERFDWLYLVSGGEIADQVPTYRGEGRTFL